MNDIKVGDVVQLKSGGPKMTVEKISNWSTTKGIQNGAMCVWFDGPKKHQDVFDLGALAKEGDKK